MVPQVVGYKSSFPTDQGSRYNSIDEAKRDIDRMWVAFSQPKPLPSPEQQGANLAQALQQFTATTGQEVFQPGGKFYRPPTATPSAPKSKLPLIIGGVALVAVAAALWWRFRK